MGSYQILFTLFVVLASTAFIFLGKKFLYPLFQKLNKDENWFLQLEPIYPP